MEKTPKNNKDVQEEPAKIIVIYSAWYNFAKKLFQVFFKTKSSKNDKK